LKIQTACKLAAHKVLPMDNSNSWGYSTNWSRPSTPP